jgi:dTDP-glucose 4,6-dehydratase
MRQTGENVSLVTGGAGFIGSALVRKLVRRGEQVVNVDKLTYAGNLANCHAVERSPLYRFHKVDICDRAAMSELFSTYRPTTVFHLAAESHVDRSIDGPGPFIETNVVGTLNLLEVARDFWDRLPASQKPHFRFLSVSTDEVYGALGTTGAFDVESRYDPSSPYAASKAAADHLARAWFCTYGLPTIVTNCGNNFGPYQFPEKLIPLTILNAYEGRELPVYGRGENVRDWIHVEDHATALERVAEVGVAGETYLIGARSEQRNIDVVRAICAAIDELAPRPDLPGGHADLIRFVADRPGHDFRYALDPTLTEKQLQWRPEKSFAAGLRETVEWYLANRAWCDSATAVYRRDRIGLAAPA